MAKLPQTTYTADSPQSFITGAGIIVYDFDIKKLTFNTFGATNGAKVELKTNLTQLEIDGILSTPVGGDIIESAEGTMEVNLLEGTLENIKMALIGADLTIEGVTGVKAIRPKGRVEVADYIKGLAHISTLQNGDKLVIVFDNAIPTEGLSLEPKDGETNALIVKFSARANADSIDDASLPVTVYNLPKDYQPNPSL
ncbi:hypothetical protein [Globicatella sp. PHS-GS-PNBC-21-1553]|uniref:hypothetical protein n=1 Tax=Globicatella sp. PHS-GS-PNBC-21-1553 TaxID=2885764 RepID=UPI00298EF081|nr:hypothetical protein [Globicatella sp. PHS-GS-PNBC-21-1553]WPC08010.1 hypothetical protein LB888_08120 [Globicatella sp. PHS-GS-PNBC-21-1553]